MKKIIGIFLAIIFSIPAFSQISFNSNTNQFSLWPSFDNWRLITIGHPGTSSNPGCKAFFEFGDGYFTTDQISINHPYNSNSNNSRLAVLTLSPRYDTIKPPRNLAKNISFSPDPFANHSQQLLTAGEFIRITPSAGEINAKEEMLYIITYKLPPGSTKARIIFFYNEDNLQVFELLHEESMVYVDTEGTTDDILPSYPRIRNHYDAEDFVGDIYTNTTLTALQGTGYQTSLAWDLEGPFDNKEHNIFLSIRTKDNLLDRTTGYVEASLQFNQNDSVSQEQESSEELDTAVVSSLRMSVSANPHDPNFIKVIPGCIEKGNGTAEVEYRIHFQNEGIGDAYKLSIDVMMDPKLKTALEELDSTSFVMDVGKRAVTCKYKLNPDKISFNLTLSFNNSPTTKSAIRDGSTLSGKTVPFPDINPLTQGDIYFKLNVPIDEEADLEAQAKIYFYNRSDLSMPAVFTNTDTLFIREHCSGMLHPRPTPLPDCCTKLGPLCWWWWIVIGAGLLFILWLVFRKRKRKKEQYNC